MKHVLLLVAMLFTSSAYAITPLAFYERPLFMSAWLPDQLPCTFDTESGEGQCIADDLPMTVNAVLVKLDGTEQRTIEYPTIGILTCYNGICDDVISTPFGLLDSPPGWPEGKKMTWLVTENYYPVNDGDHVTAWRRGKGPKATTYPEPMIYSEHHYTKEVDGQVTYTVWCNPQADVCDLADKEVTRHDLPKYIPIKFTNNCAMEFCYDDKENVVGLNPDYYGDSK